MISNRRPLRYSSAIRVTILSSSSRETMVRRGAVSPMASSSKAARGQRGLKMLRAVLWV